MEIGKRVRELRLERDLTQGELGDRAGVSLQAVSLIETGHRVPSATTVEGIARGLGVEPGVLFQDPLGVA